MIIRISDGQTDIGIKFPATPDEVSKLRSMLSGDVRIIDVSSQVDNLTGYIQNTDLGNAANIEKLNTLAEEIDRMNQWEHWTFAGALDAESINSLDDVLKIASQLEDYTMIASVTSNRELGEFLVDSGYLQIAEHLRPYINYASVGAEYYANFGGAYTCHGYVRRSEQEPMLGSNEKPAFRVKLQAQDGARQYHLNLPATDAWIDTAKRHLRIDDIQDAQMIDISCTIPGLAEILPMEGAALEDADQLAEYIREMQKTDGELAKYLAALTVENPRTFSEALTIAIDQDDYEFVPGDPAEYGEQVLRRIGADDELIETIDGFMDFEGLGEISMEQDGVRRTDFGLIRRLSEPFPEPQMGQQML